MEQLECSELVSRGITGTTALKTCSVLSSKAKHIPTLQHGNSTPRFQLNRNHRFVHQKTHFLKQHYSLYPKPEAIQISINSENISGDFSGSPVVRTLHFHCRGRGFNPWWRNCTMWPKTNKSKNK